MAAYRLRGREFRTSGRITGSLRFGAAVAYSCTALFGWVSNSKMTSSSSVGSKFWLLLWKNWLLQRRKKLQTVIEVVLPVVFCILLVIIRDLAPSDNFPEPTFFKPFSIDELPVNLTPSVGPGLFDDIADSILGDVSRRRRRDLRRHDGLTPDLLLKQANVRQTFQSQRNKMRLRRNTRRKRFIDFFGFGDFFGSSWWPLAYAPNNTAVNRIMLIVADRISVNVEGYGFATERDLVEHLTKVSKKGDKEQLDLSGIEDVLGAVVFTNNFPGPETLPDDIAHDSSDHPYYIISNGRFFRDQQYYPISSHNFNYFFQSWQNCSTIQT
ncbi:uncharacterized protein LOC134765237 [Penaeus indicus]|uniref:uncharacterized protein LOC134765237 n=1 Tax=Penaeus indicus TaxID=29960 RepID=UPI00300C4948